MDILSVLNFLNYFVGTAVVASSFNFYFTKNETIPLYIALAIIIAGPLEDFLITYIERSPSLSPADKEQYAKIVDNTTSLAFLILLGLAVLKATYY